MEVHSLVAYFHTYAQLIFMFVFVSFFCFCRPWLSAQEIVLLTMDSSSLQLIINNKDSLMQTYAQAKLIRTNFYLSNHTQITLGIVKLTNNANQDSAQKTVNYIFIQKSVCIINCPHKRQMYILNHVWIILMSSCVEERHRKLIWCPENGKLRCCLYCLLYYL